LGHSGTAENHPTEPIVTITVKVGFGGNLSHFSDAI
jgi:hypothetical protein